MQVSQEIFSVGPRQVRRDPAAIRAAVMAEIAKGNGPRMMRELGIALDAKAEGQLRHMFAMDADPVAPLTTATIPGVIQFLQAWLPGVVEVITAARLIDDLVGVITGASWEDEEIVQTILEHTGKAQLYGDLNVTPRASWNVNFERRGIVRFETGMQVGRLEEARAAKIKVSTGEAKRGGAATALEIQRNTVGFSGFNSGANRVYGFLNDPNLPAYTNVPAGASTSTLWSAKTYLEIIADIQSAMAALRVQSQERINIEKDPITLAIATAAVDRLSTVSTYGNSVRDWLTKTYPNVRVVSAPELSAANGGQNVFYLYAEKVNDSGTDDQRTIVQIVPSKFVTLGVQQYTKGYEEAYSNAVAGVLVKRPYAIVRRSHI